MKLALITTSALAVSAAFGTFASAAQGKDAASFGTSPQARAEATLQAMTPDERTVLTFGIMPTPFGNNPPPVPADALPGAGYVAGIPRLGIPALKETDASLGVAYVSGLRNDGATPLPSGLAMAATWNSSLLRRAGQMIGSEARAKGFNVMLAGGVNLMRDPRNGRTFEYLSEDPLLSGVLAGNAIAGIQSNHIISTIKHFALNGQETGRQYANVTIADSSARESDLLAFQIGIEIGNPGSVMCAYNRVHGKQACDSDYLLNKVLKHDWHYKGFVMSDWGAVPNLGTALNGLDQQSGAQLDPAIFFGKPLAKAAIEDARFAARLQDMNRRLLWAIYANGLDMHPVGPGGKIDVAANGEIAEEVAKQGIVLLRNQRNALPLARGAKRIAVIGGYANAGVLSGGGSSQSHGEGGPAVLVQLGRKDMPFANFLSQQYHDSVPIEAIRKMAPGATVIYRDGAFPSEAAAQAAKADVAIVFATKWSTEGIDQVDFTLPNGQDALIAAVAAANPNTIVVLETGNPVLMPWLDKTAAVVEAWYPGARGGQAVASVLFGEANPSGRLPITFPASTADLPRPKVDGSDWIEPTFLGAAPNAEAQLSVNYDIEGSDVGYRWFSREGRKTLFPFGFGLSYSNFEAKGLKVSGNQARFTVKNTGPMAGAYVAQLYLVARNGQSKRRLAGFERIDLLPAQTREITLTIDPRILADWNGGGWTVAGGEYGFALGENAETLGPITTVDFARRSWRD